MLEISEIYGIFNLVKLQEMITKDEEIGKLRSNLKRAQDTSDDHESEVKRLTSELEVSRRDLTSIQSAMESEKAATVEEMSLGKSNALESLKSELNEKFIKEKEELEEKHRLELSEKEESMDKERQVKSSDRPKLKFEVSAKTETLTEN